MITRLIMNSSSLLCEPGQSAGTVAKCLLINSHALQHREIQIAERRLLREAQPPSGLQRALASARERDRQIVLQMQIAALDATPEHHHRIVEQRRAALIE